MAKKKSERPPQTEAERKAWYKKRAARRAAERAVEVANARRARTQQITDAARLRRKEAEPTPALMARRGARATAAARKVFEEWLLAVKTQEYAMTARGSSREGLAYFLRGALSELDDYIKEMNGRP